MSGFDQRLDSGPGQTMAQAVGDRMGDYDKTLHFENSLRDTKAILAQALVMRIRGFEMETNPQWRSRRRTCDRYTFDSNQTAYSLPFGSLK
nr:hypothetical protein [uncultured Halomonas sp.]